MHLIPYFSVDASATGAGVAKVEILFPSPTGCNDVARFKPSADIPDAILDLWGVSGQYILATMIPDSASPGTFALTIKATDTAGKGRVTPSLSSPLPELPEQ